MISLSDAIESLRTELTTAIEQGHNQRMRFVLAPVEMSLQVVVTKAASGKIGWKILEAGGSYQSAGTQTLNLTLTPYWTGEDGSPTTSPLIAGRGSELDTIGPQPQR